MLSQLTDSECLVSGNTRENLQFVRQTVLHSQQRPKLTRFSTLVGFMTRVIQ